MGSSVPPGVICQSWKQAPVPKLSDAPRRPGVLMAPSKDLAPTAASTTGPGIQKCKRNRLQRGEGRDRGHAGGTLPGCAAQAGGEGNGRDALHQSRLPRTFQKHHHSSAGGMRARRGIRHRPSWQAQDPLGSQQGRAECRALPGTAFGHPSSGLKGPGHTQG